MVTEGTNVSIAAYNCCHEKLVKQLKAILKLLKYIIMHYAGTNNTLQMLAS